MCSLEEAFLDWSEPRNLDSERKKKKKRSAALPAPEPAVIEPDRPAHRRLPPAELLGGSVTENTQSSSEPSPMLNALDATSYFPNPARDNNDKNLYKLEPDWTKVFENTEAPDWIKQRLPNREAEVPLVPSPLLDGYSTLWARIPDSAANQPGLQTAKIRAESRIDDLQARLDSMFAKLDEIEVTRAESNHLEIIMFVLGGIFLLLLLDVLVKQGTQATMILAAAAGGSLPSSLKGFKFSF